MKSILGHQQSAANRGGNSHVTWKDGADPNKGQEKKGSAVLTNESLSALAKEVCSKGSKGLVLAMLLNIPTTRLVNMQLEGHASNHTETDMCISMLHHWRELRATAKEKDKVADLERGLKEAGYAEMADIVVDRHKENAELTADAFPV